MQTCPQCPGTLGASLQAQADATARAPQPAQRRCPRSPPPCPPHRRFGWCSRSTAWVASACLRTLVKLGDRRCAGGERHALSHPEAGHLLRQIPSQHHAGRLHARRAIRRSMPSSASRSGPTAAAHRPPGASRPARCPPVQAAPGRPAHAWPNRPLRSTAGRSTPSCRSRMMRWRSSWRTRASWSSSMRAGAPDSVASTATMAPCGRWATGP